MDPDEERVKDYLAHRGFVCQRVSKKEMRSSKTPDFCVNREGNFLFYCEVKSIKEDRWLDDLLEEAPPGTLVGGGRNDPIFNRLTAHIHTAVKQFDAVNPGEEFPNVLALVNRDNTCGFNDILAILTGNFYADDGSAHPIYRQFSEGRIKDEKRRIHLFIWLDDYKDRLLFSQTHEELHSKLCEWFGIDPRSIKQIGS